MSNGILVGLIVGIFIFCVIECFLQLTREDPLDKYESVCSAKLHDGKTIHFLPYFNPEITSQKDKKIADCCSNYLALQDAPLFDHMSLVDGEIWLYRDEIMNDDVISRIQDALGSTERKIKIVYDWKH